MGILGQTATERLGTILQAIVPGGSGFVGSTVPQYVGGIGSGWDGAAGRPMVLWEQLASFNGWNYVAIKRIMDTAAGVFPKLGRVVRKSNRSTMDTSARQHLRAHYQSLMSDGEDIAPIDSHVFLDLLEQPNPHDSWSAFAAEYQLFWQLTGRVYVWVIPNTMKLPAQVWVVPPQAITPIPDPRDRTKVLKWQIRSVFYGGLVDAPPEQVLWRWGKSPYGKEFSHSTTEAIAPWVRSAMTVEDARAASFRNEIKPDVWVDLDRDMYPRADAKDIEAIKALIMRDNAGVQQRGGARVKPPGTSIQRIDRPPTEMDYVDSDDQLRDKIGAGVGVNRFVMGVPSDMNRSTAEVADEAFARRTMNPALSQQAEVLTQIARVYDPSLIVTFPDVCPANRELLRAEGESLFDRAGASPDELRERLGLCPLNIRGVSDVPWIRSGFIPATLAAEPPAEPVIPQPGDGADPADQEAEDDTAADDAEDDPAEGQPADDAEDAAEDDAAEGDATPAKKPAKGKAK